MHLQLLSTAQDSVGETNPQTRRRYSDKQELETPPRERDAKFSTKDYAMSSTSSIPATISEEEGRGEGKGGGIGGLKGLEEGEGQIIPVGSVVHVADVIDAQMNEGQQQVCV